ncbi:MAG TPA: lectin [Xanthomonadaceae bacterium]|nr:lectin [Xanthomonadaceae bacterium]
MNRPVIASLLSLALLCACAREAAPTDAGDATDAPPATTPVDQPTEDQPAEDIPPATAPGVSEALAERQASVPEPGAPDGDRDLARFDGYGDVRFGIVAEAMEQAWGGELATLGKEGNESCYFMTPTAAKTPAEFNFMIGDGKFVRFGTESDKFVAPGGGKVGMTRAEIGKLYAGRVEEQPHKYSDGLYLRIKDPAGGNGVLIFETDAKGDTAKVTEWRVGVPPQVDYVEGCS